MEFQINDIVQIIKYYTSHDGITRSGEPHWGMRYLRLYKITKISIVDSEYSITGIELSRGDNHQQFNKKELLLVQRV